MNIQDLNNNIIGLNSKIESSSNKLFKSKFAEKKSSSFGDSLSQIDRGGQSSSPQLNYKIEEPEGDINKRSAIFAEINFKSDKLHILGLKNGELFWIETEDC